MAVSVGFRDGVPVEGDLARCVSVSGPGLGEIAASKRAVDLAYTLLLVEPGASAAENETARAAVKAVMAARPAQERIAVVRWGTEVTQVSPFLAERPTLEERIGVGLVAASGAPAPAADALAVAGSLLRKIGGAGASAQRTLIIVSARAIPALSKEALKGAEPALVLWLGAAGGGSAVQTLPSALRFPFDGAGDAAKAAGAASERIDAYKKHGHYVLGTCGAPSGGELTLRAGSAQRKTAVAASLPEQRGGACKAAPLASGSYRFPRRIELAFTPEQRAAADGLYRMRSKESFDLSVRMSPDSEPSAATGHFRGESSYPCARRNYSVNLGGKAARFVFPGFAHDKFHLLSMCLDRLYLRNFTVLSVLAAEGLFPVPFDLVELVVDGQEQGVYMLVENVTDSLRVHQSAVSSVIRRYKVQTGPGTMPEVRWSASSVGDDMALAGYQQILAGVEGLAGEKLEAGLRARLNLDQYLLWMAILNSLQSGDYVDEVFFYAAETTGADGKRADWHLIMGWDQEDVFTPCHYQGVYAVNDPAGLVYCAESELDRRIFGDAHLYRRYAEGLGRWLERFTVERFGERLRATAGRLLGHFENAKVLGAMSELGNLNPAGLMSLDVARGMIEKDLELLATQYSEQRRTLLARLQKLGMGLPPDSSKVPDGGVTGESGPGQLVALRMEPPPADVDPARVVPSRAGTRLKLVTVEGDGARFPAGFLDTTLGERCGFQKLPDGSYRCLPSRTQVSTLRYGDAACTKPVQAIPAGACDPPTFVVQRMSDVCPTGQIFFRRTKKLTETAVFIKNPAAGTCIAAPALAPTDVLYELEPAAPSTFAGAMARADGSGRLVGELLESADGAQDLVGFRDSMLGHSCFPLPATDGVTRCLPSTQVLVLPGFFIDDQCRMPAAYGEITACTSAEYALRQDQMRCESRFAIFKGGDRAERLFSGAGGRCTAVIAPGLTFYALGAEVPAATLAEGFGAGALPGTGRLRVQVLTAGNKADPTGLFYDGMLKVSCRADFAADGVLRCLPPADGPSSLFADSLCTMPLASRGTGCDPPPLVSVRSGATCPARASVRRVGQAFRGQVYGRDGMGRCISRVYPQDQTLFHIGPELPATDFAELKLQM